MFDIHFYTLLSYEEAQKGTEAYQTIWVQKKELITSTVESTTKLLFATNPIKAQIIKGKNAEFQSADHFDLGYLLPDNNKYALLCHELLHKLLIDNHLIVPKQKPPELLKTKIHQVIFLVLYDIWSLLENKKFADEAVEREKKYGDAYADAWNYALALTQDQRKERFAKVVKNLKHYYEVSYWPSFDVDFGLGNAA